jgi:hypothetical protein
MPANKNMSVCVATSPRPLIEIDANRTGQKPTGPQPRGQNIIRPPPGAEPGASNAADQRITGRHAARRPGPAKTAPPCAAVFGHPELPVMAQSI